MSTNDTSDIHDQGLCVNSVLGQSELTAFHEAGHCITKILRDESVSVASIGPRAGDLGHAFLARLYGKPTSSCEPKLRTRVLANIESLLAGPAAVAQRLARAADSKVDPLPRAVAFFKEAAAGQPDLQEAKRLARAISFSEQEARHLLRFLRLRVAGRFSRRRPIWRAVEVVATALLKHREIEGNHVAWLVNQALRGKTYPDLAAQLSHRICKGPGRRSTGVAAKFRSLST